MEYFGYYSDAITAFSALLAATGIVIAVFQFIRYDRSARDNLRYLEEREFYGRYNRLREEIESQISELNSRLTDTDEEFRNVNHLVLEAQEADDTLVASGSVKGNTFLDNMNVKIGEIDYELIFVLTPFHPREKLTYSAIVESFSGFDVKVRRGDEVHSDNILKHIVESLVKARIVIANISSRNPNVMYELGIAHALGKHVILISSSKEENLPFDLRHTRVLFYKTRNELVEKLRDEIARRFFSTS